MGALAKFWTDASVENRSKCLIFLPTPINLILQGCDRWALRTSFLEIIEFFVHRSIQLILGIKTNEVKKQRITNEASRKKLFNITNIKKQIPTGKLTFIGKGARNYDDHIPTKFITMWCNQKRRHGDVLDTNKKSIVHNLHLVISGV